MLAATAIVALASYELMLPTMNAQRFIRAVAAGDYRRADACFCDPADRFLFDYFDKHWRFKATAALVPSSLTQVLHGERRITLRAMWGDAGPMRAGSWIVAATRAGLHSPAPAWFGGGFGGGGLADVRCDAATEPRKCANEPTSGRAAAIATLTRSRTEEP